MLTRGLAAAGPTIEVGRLAAGAGGLPADEAQPGSPAAEVPGHDGEAAALSERQEMAEHLRALCDASVGDAEGLLDLLEMYGDLADNADNGALADDSPA